MVYIKNKKKELASLTAGKFQLEAGGRKSRIIYTHPLGSLSIGKKGGGRDRSFCGCVCDNLVMVIAFK
jgi:hypothetical protein